MNYNKNNTSRRPKEVSDEHFESEWDRIFGKKIEASSEAELYEKITGQKSSVLEEDTTN